MLAWIIRIWKQSGSHIFLLDLKNNSLGNIWWCVGAIPDWWSLLAELGGLCHTSICYMLGKHLTSFIVLMNFSFFVLPVVVWLLSHLLFVYLIYSCFLAPINFSLPFSYIICLYVETWSYLSYFPQLCTDLSKLRVQSWDIKWVHFIC